MIRNPNRVMFNCTTKERRITLCWHLWNLHIKEW